MRSAADRIATRIADYLDVAPSADPVLRKAIRTKWHDTRAAAVFLQTYRWLGTGPELTKIGLRIVYSLEMLVSSNPTNTEKRLAA